MTFIRRATACASITATFCVLAIPACKHSSSQQADSHSPAPVDAPPVQLPPAPPLRDANLPTLPNAQLWAPQRYVLGDPSALATALQSYESVALALDSTVAQDPGEITSVEMVTALSPKTSVVARGSSILKAMMVERGELPQFKSATTDGTHDMFGRPNYKVEDIKLPTDLTDKAKKLKGARAILAIQSADLPRDRFATLREQTTGGCTAAFQSAEASIADAQQKLAPFREYSDQVLASAYRSYLSATLPEWRENLKVYAEKKERHEFADVHEWERYDCGHRHLELINNLSGCADAGQCVAPQLYLDGGVGIGIRSQPQHFPRYCKDAAIPDYPGELDKLTRAAVDNVITQFPPEWLEYAARTAALIELPRRLDELCHPQFARYPAAGIEQLRAELDGALKGIQNPAVTQPLGQWNAMSGGVNDPQIGALQALTTFRLSLDHPSQIALQTISQLPKKLQSMKLCASGRDSAKSLAVTLVDTGSSEVRFVGYFYQTELMCPGVGLTDY